MSECLFADIFIAILLRILNRNRMAIDTKSLSTIITEFRALQSKDAVSPESLGYILQRIVDLLATAGTSETVANIQKLLDGFKAAGQAVTAITQGKADRNHIYAAKSTVNLSTGARASSEDIFIQQATTERAGAMRAQQVVDLNSTKSAVAQIEKTLAALQVQVGQGGASAKASTSNISVQVINGKLRVIGASELIAAGFVPYLFRHTRKRNQWHHRADHREGLSVHSYCPKRKGWNLYGSVYAVKVQTDGTLTFANTRERSLSVPHTNYLTAPDALMHIHTRRTGEKTVAWGRSTVKVADCNCPAKERMLRFRFALAFGQKKYPGRHRITTANMVTTLAEFSIVYDPQSKSFSYSR